MKKKFEKFTISQVAVLIKNKKCLILEFADRPGLWGLPGGRIDIRETCEEAFKRELNEELGINRFKILGIVDFDIWVTKKGVPVSAIVYLIKSLSNNYKLSQEHSRMEWVSLRDINKYNFLWPNTKRMIKNGFKKYYK